MSKTVLEIKDDQIKKVLTENITEILKDVMTGWNSPVKRLFEDKEGELYKAIQSVAEKTFKEVVNSKDFQENLKEKLMQVAVENMMKR